MTNTIIQLLITQRYANEYVNRSYDEMVSCFKYELNEYKNEKYLKMQEQLEAYFNSNDWLKNAFYNRLARYSSTGNSKYLSKPLTNEDIKVGVADNVSENSSGSEEVSSSTTILENFNVVYQSYLELTNMLVDRLEYIFSSVI